MPVPAANLYPPFNIVRLSHVEYSVTDLAASRAFYVDTLGLQITFEDATHIYLRAMEERGHHCITLVQAEKSEVKILGLKLYDEPDLEPIRWALDDPQRQTLWGAPAPRSWFENGPTFAGVEPIPSQMTAQPIIAP